MGDGINGESGRDGYCGSTTPRDRRNQMYYTSLLAVWAVLFVGSSFLIAGDRVVAGPVGWGLVGLSSLVAVLAVLAYWRYLRHADELARAIELQALAGAVCAGFIVWPAFELIGELGMDVGALPNPVVMIMIVVYALGSVLGRRRYR